MTYYDAALTNWLKSYCGRTFRLYQEVSSTVSTAFGNSASVKTAVNGSRKTEIWPFSLEVFGVVPKDNITMTEGPIDESKEPSHVIPEDDITTTEHRIDEPGPPSQGLPEYDNILVTEPLIDKPR